MRRQKETDEIANALQIQDLGNIQKECKDLEQQMQAVNSNVNQKEEIYNRHIQVFEYKTEQHLNEINRLKEELKRKNFELEGIER